MVLYNLIDVIILLGCQPARLIDTLVTTRPLDRKNHENGQQIAVNSTIS